MRRIVEITPGWDCVYAPCTHEKSCNNGTPPNDPALASRRSHGISSDTWHFHLIAEDNLTAMCLRVASTDFPATIPPDRRGTDRTMAMDLSLFGRFPLTRSDARDWNGEINDADDIFSISIGTCHSTGLGAVKLWDTHGDLDAAAHDQPESFWAAFEEEFRSADRSVRPCLDLRPCPRCKGDGLVTRDTL